MRLLLIFLLCGCICGRASANQLHPIDTALQFNKHVTECENQWVAFAKKDTSQRYAYGFIYVDAMAGFTFDLKGFFTIDGKGHYISDTSMTRTAGYKYRLSDRSAPVAVLSPQRLKELNLPPQPSWLKIYASYTDDAIHNYRWGYNYNAAGNSQKALTYLDKAYQADPDIKGLDFEIIYAYNALHRYNDAITFLKKCMAKHPDDVMLYREMGYAQLNSGNTQSAIDWYLKGIALCTNMQMEAKSEMAVNLAKAYQVAGNDAENKAWIAKAKSWAPPGSNIERLMKEKNL